MSTRTAERREMKVKEKERGREKERLRNNL